MLLKQAPTSGAMRAATNAWLVGQEQGFVQTQLNAFQKRDPGGYATAMQELNQGLNNMSSFSRTGPDRIFGGAVAEVQQRLGRNLDFRNQADRQTLGNQINSDLLLKNCTGTRAYGACQ